MGGRTTFALAAAGAVAVAVGVAESGCAPPPASAPAEPVYTGPPGGPGEEGEPGSGEGEWESGQESAESGPRSEPGTEPGSESGSESGPGTGSESGSGSGSESEPGLESASASPGASPTGPPAGGHTRPRAGATGSASAFEAGVAAAVNRLRRDPAGFAAALGRHRQNYQENYLYLPGVDSPIITVEGVRAVDEAIAVARRLKPRPELRLSPGLSRAARDHAIEIGRHGTVDHDGRDGSQPHQRMDRHGRIQGLSGENIGTGYGDAATMVMSLFIDDGIRSRGHRVNFLEPEYGTFGVGCAPHRRFGTVCVIDFAAGFRE
jgi:Cysteine-rich secretory protein family